MRIFQFVSLISKDGAFGGPVSVARSQCEELARRGHDVTLFAGWDGEAMYEIPGVNVRLRRVRRLLPTPGFSGLIAPALLREFASVVPSVDVAHVHMARDLTTLSAAAATARKGRRLVLQTHGMVMPDDRLVGKMTDAIATRRLLARADTVAALTEIEREGIRQVAAGTVKVELLPNGIDLRTDTAPSAYPRDEAPIVLFCARLHPRKRVLAFAQMAETLVGRGSDARFLVAGPDEGDLAALREFLEDHGITAQVDYLGALPPHRVRDTLARASVFVLPSEREPFPMTLLEAMSEGTPSVITTGCMIADRFQGVDGPVVTDGSPAQLADAVERLLTDRTYRTRVGRTSRELIKHEFSIGAVVDQLEVIYSRARVDR